MRSNINKVSERRENLNSLQDKTDNLAMSAQGFRRGANRVRKQMWWKDMKMRMCLIVGIIILLIVIIVPSGKCIRRGLTGTILMLSSHCWQEPLNVWPHTPFLQKRHSNRVGSKKDILGDQVVCGTLSVASTCELDDDLTPFPIANITLDSPHPPSTGATQACDIRSAYFVD